MKRRWVGIAVLLLYLATGFYIVRGDEQAVVRRFGKARFPLVTSGLHYDLPWPWSQVDRLNLQQMRTVTIGLTTREPLGDSGFLRELTFDREAEFLTGDKNILNLQVNVQFQVTDPYRFLFASESPEIALRLLAESLVTDVVARSGVDYVQPLGLIELQVLLTDLLRQEVERQAWGVSVEDVTITSVLPPIEVKAAFLDVSNARAEKDRVIHAEQMRGEQLLARTRATAQQLLDRATGERHARVEAARGAADRFLKIVAQFRQEAETGPHAYATVRDLARHRMYTSMLEELLPRLAGKLFLNTERPVDLTIFPEREAPPAAPAEGP